MAFDLSWKFEIADYNGLTDITSYVYNGMVNMTAEVGQMGRSYASITINNNSGAFTPNGAGTFASTNWFAKALYIRASSATTFQNNCVFVGLITDFSVENVSIVQSTVTIRADDFLTIAGRSTTQVPYAAWTTDAPAMISDMINGGATFFNGINTPYMGAANKSRLSLGLGTTIASGAGTTIFSTELSNGRIGDWVNNQIIPAMPGTSFMTDYTISAGAWYWRGYVLDHTLNRTTADKRTYSFVDTYSASISSGEIPYTDIDINYDLDTLTNTADTADNLGSWSGSATDTISANQYGVRARQYTSLANVNVVEVQYVAEFWANRYGTSSYIPRTIWTNYAALRGTAVDDGVALTAFIDLLTASTAIWNPISCQYRLAGMASSATAQIVATGRQITITPSNTSIKLTTVSGPDNQSFILDSSTYGILDTNRLG